MSDLNSLIDKATSALLLDIDWDTTLQIVDMIRQGDATSSNCINALLPKLHDSNPNIVLLALQVLESIVKNCGQSVHEHVATWDFMAEIRTVLKKSSNEDVQKKILLLLATWVYAFRSQPKYQSVQDTVNIIKAEGFKIPSVVESDAMFTADSAPDWADSDCCHRCRTQFTMIRRKHHCRACGQVFCHDCSNKGSTIPKFGIEREVRVCEHCYDEINNPLKTSSATTTEPKSEAAKNKTSNPDKKTEEELREEEELQLALALSKSEAENKVKEKLRATSDLLGGGYRSNEQRSTNSFSPQKFAAPSERDDSDPELAKYLNRSFWEQREKQMTKDTTEELHVQPSAPFNATKTILKTSEYFQNGGVEEVDEFVSTLRSHLEIFVNRMKSNQSRGRPIANDTAVQSLFMNITAMHSQLLTYIQDQDKKRVHGEQLQDKISQIHDARAALDALREEHRDKLRREKEEQERVRQIQMMQKLEIMRKKKQEYLEYQRQLALHRMAESERQILSGQQHNAVIPPPGHPQQPVFTPIRYSAGYPQNPRTVNQGYAYPPPVDGAPGQGMMTQYPPQAAPVGPNPPTMAYPPQTHPNSEFGHYTIPSGPPSAMSNVPAPGFTPGAPSAAPPLQESQAIVSQTQLQTNPQQEEAPLISFD